MLLLILPCGAGPRERVDVLGVTRTLWQILLNGRLKVFLLSILIPFEQLPQRSFSYPNLIFLFPFVNSICVLRHRR